MKCVSIFVVAASTKAPHDVRKNEGKAYKKRFSVQGFEHKFSLNLHSAPEADVESESPYNVT